MIATSSTRTRSFPSCLSEQRPPGPATGHGTASGLSGIIAKPAQAPREVPNRNLGKQRSEIDIRRKHGKSLKAAKAAVDKTAAAIGRKFGIHSEWDGDNLNFHRAGGHGP